MYDMVAELSMLISSADLQRAWESEKSVTALPSVTFTANGPRVAMRFSSDRGSLPSIQEIKRSFAIAMGRKGAFPSCRIHWLT
jgi:hypothetical protein